MKGSVKLVMSKVEGMTVFNTEEVNTKKQPMYFGKPLGGEIIGSVAFVTGTVYFNG